VKGVRQARALHAAFVWRIGASGYSLNAVANDKIPVIALVHCAQNGKIPPCQLVTGDFGDLSSSMKTMCAALKIPFKDITDSL
jgi:hypothetical protein